MARCLAVSHPFSVLFSIDAHSDLAPSVMTWTPSAMVFIQQNTCNKHQQTTGTDEECLRVLGVFGTTDYGESSECHECLERALHFDPCVATSALVADAEGLGKAEAMYGFRDGACPHGCAQ